MGFVSLQAVLRHECDRRAALVAHSPVYDGLSTLLVALDVGDREGFLRPEVVGEAAVRRVMDALLQQGATNEDIAERCGYTETRSFYRAFSRWTGIPDGLTSQSTSIMNLNR